jgi:hypothetical protein
MLEQQSRHADAPSWQFGERAERLATSYQGKRLIELVSVARAEGLEVGLIPFILCSEVERHHLMPRSRPSWFKNYGARLLELAELGRELGVRELVIGSELSSLFGESEAWRDLAGLTREVFPGELTISCVVPQYLLIKFWDALDSIGISAYFPLTPHPRLRAPRALESVWALWRYHLLEVARARGKPLTFVEVGYPSTHVAAFMPWDYRYGLRRLDPELAAACWRAFARTWAEEPWLRGCRVWGLSVLADEPAASFNPLGKPAEDVLRAFFAERIREAQSRSTSMRSSRIGQ